MHCGTCQNIFRGPLLVAERVSESGDIVFLRDHHHEVRDLRQSALEGCYICDRLWHLIRRRGGDTSMTLNLETCGLKLSKWRSGIPVALSFKYGLSNGEKVEEHFRLWPTCGTYPLISHP
jgi:hypothetical protein